MAEILTVFYSLKGETIAPGMKIVKLEKGHTAVAAEFVQKAVGGDIFELETVKTYIEDHMKMIYEAKEELEKGIYPELKNYPDIDKYDTIFLGFPNWWNTIPTPMFNFLKRYDWSGKRIIPFVTSGGGGLGRSIEDIKKICVGAEISNGGEFLGHEVETAEKEISNWAKDAI
ncbi:MAG: flavodoxin [Oscillospiraceae bacterium]|nr:flavodoxin [Oscillospiraceae bacterium]